MGNKHHIQFRHRFIAGSNSPSHCPEEARVIKSRVNKPSTHPSEAIGIPNGTKCSITDAITSLARHLHAAVKRRGKPFCVKVESIS